MILNPTFSVDFNLNNREVENREPVSVEMLPCQFKESHEHCNRAIYFDPCIQQAKEDDKLKEVLLQGRRMLGKEYNLAEKGFSGRVLGIYSDELDAATGQRKFQMQMVDKFDKVTDWHKDQYDPDTEDKFDEQKAFVADMMRYLECSQILHAE